MTITDVLHSDSRAMATQAGNTPQIRIKPPDAVSIIQDQLENVKQLIRENEALKQENSALRANVRAQSRATARLQSSLREIRKAIRGLPTEFLQSQQDHKPTASLLTLKIKKPAPRADNSGN